MKVTDGLYAYPWRGRGNNCNSYFIDGEKPVLVDPGHIYNEFQENGLEALERGLRADGFKLESIDLIICTHGHPDHVEAAGVIRERSGARLAMHKDDEFFLEVMEKQYASLAGREPPSLRPDFYLQEGELIVGYEEPLALQVIHTPGHSPGSICLLLPDRKALLTGDTVFHHSIGRADLPGGDMTALEASVARLAAIAGVELLLPGHMGLVAGEENVAGNFQLIRRAFFG